MQQEEPSLEEIERAMKGAFKELDKKKLEDIIPHPVFQTKFGDTEGNCTHACIATMVMCKLEEVPKLSNDNKWISELNEWLAKKGFYCAIADSSWDVPKDAFVMAGGKSPSGLGHYVIMKNGKLMHDPHPSGEGLVGEIEDYLLIVPLKPWNYEMVWGCYLASIRKQLAD